MIDSWLFAPNTAGRLRRVRTLLALLVAARLLLSPFRGLAKVPDALFVPVSGLVPFRSVPPVEVIVAVQVVGAAAALLAASGRRPRLNLPVAWLALLALAGLRSSLGKILHNDVLLLLAVLPFLAAPDVSPTHDESSSPRFGWPIRTAMVMVALTYWYIGAQKLVHSGVAWVTGPNMRWILYSAASEGRALSREPALFIADRPWLATASAAFLLGLELVFPLALFWRRARPAIVIAAVALHTGTWILLGLDYWLWVAVVAVLFLVGEPLRPAADPNDRPPAAAAPLRSPD
ncbi:MAG: hypothetical protein QOG87_2497 [Actinomycetota bacterium]